MDYKIEEFKQYLKLYDRSLNTLNSYLTTVTRYTELLTKNNISLENTEPKHIVAFFQTYGENWSASSKNQRLTVLKTYYTFLYSNGYVKENIAQKVQRFKEPIRETIYLSEDTFAQLLKAVENNRNKERDRAILALASLCCMRVSEISSLNLEDIAGDTIAIIGKGNKQRTIPFVSSAKKAVMNYLEVREETTDNALFISQKTKKRMTIRAIQSIIENLSKKIGVDFHTHTLRHTGATHIYKATNDIVSVQEILGHTSLTTTRKYVHNNKESKQIAAESSKLTNLI